MTAGRRLVQTKLSEGLSCLPPNSDAVTFTTRDKLFVVALGATGGGLVRLPTNFLIREEHTVAHVHVGEWVFRCPRASGEGNVFFYFHHSLKPLKYKLKALLYLFLTLLQLFFYI
jgi:hypothetical protein